MSEEEETVEITQSFWGIVLKPGEKKLVESPDEVYTIISNASLAELPENAEEKPSKLIAYVETVSLPEGNEKADVSSVQTVLAELIPGKTEQTSLSNIFGPLSSVSLENQGVYDIHVSGYYQQTGEDEEEDLGDEEDFEEEDKKDKKKK